MVSGPVEGGLAGVESPARPMTARFPMMMPGEGFVTRTLTRRTTTSEWILRGKRGSPGVCGRGRLRWSSPGGPPTTATSLILAHGGGYITVYKHNQGAPDFHTAKGGARDAGRAPLVPREDKPGSSSSLLKSGTTGSRRILTGTCCAGGAVSVSRERTEPMAEKRSVDASVTLIAATTVVEGRCRPREIRIGRAGRGRSSVAEGCAAIGPQRERRGDHQRRGRHACRGS